MRRQQEVLNSLAHIATKEAESEDFRNESAFVRAYAVALGITVPEHTTRILFADGKFFETAWELDYARIIDLAAYLSWIQAKDAFPDLAKMARSEDEEQRLREALMIVTGNVFPAGHRATAIIRDFSEAMESEARRGDLREQGVPVSEEHPIAGLHFRAVAQILSLPLTMSEVEPATLMSAQLFLLGLWAEACVYFRRRAWDLFKSHVEGGVTPFQ